MRDSSLRWNDARPRWNDGAVFSQIRSSLRWNDGFAFRFVVALFLAAIAIGAAAADYPQRPVRFVVPFPPGGTVDALARILAPKLAETMGEPWIVDNRGGAAGNIASEIVARSAPDGYTVLMALSPLVTANPSLYKLPFSVEKELQGVTQLATSQYVLVLHPGVPANSVKELVALAKQKPRALNYSSGGVGSPLHLAAELFQRRAGVQLVHIPYKGGAAAVTGVITGEAHILFGSFASSMGQIKAGRLKAIATTGSQRSHLAPELPTLAESGYPGLEVTSWFGLLVRTGTPAAIVQRIRTETLKALQVPDVVRAAAREGLDIQTSTPEELDARIRSDTQTWAEVIKSAGIKPE